MLHNNVRSLKRNLENFQTHLLQELDFNFSVIGITETKISILDKTWEADLGRRFRNSINRNILFITFHHSF
jgi:hypothetical protein